MALYGLIAFIWPWKPYMALYGLMEPYGALMEPYGALMEPYGALWSPYGALGFQLGFQLEAQAQTHGLPPQLP